MRKEFNTRASRLNWWSDANCIYRSYKRRYKKKTSTISTLQSRFEHLKWTLLAVFAYVVHFIRMYLWLTALCSTKCMHTLANVASAAIKHVQKQRVKENGIACLNAHKFTLFSASLQHHPWAAFSCISFTTTHARILSDICVHKMLLSSCTQSFSRVAPVPKRLSVSSTLLVLCTLKKIVRIVCSAFCIFHFCALFFLLFSALNSIWLCAPLYSTRLEQNCQQAIFLLLCPAARVLDITALPSLCFGAVFGAILIVYNVYIRS